MFNVFKQHIPESEKITEVYQPDRATIKVGDVEIRPVEGTAHGCHQVFIDGKELSYVSKIVITLEADDVPTATIERFLPPEEWHNRRPLNA